MYIGSVKIEGSVFLAPMAGVSDLCFRRLCHEKGCPLSYTEMISSKALAFASEKTRRLAQCDALPTAVQIFGSEPHLCAEAAHAVEGGALFVDINMGCPAPKIVSNGDGSALMRDVYRAAKIVEACVAACEKPVTVKIRLGWDEEHINYIEVAKALQAAGAAAITLHARTRSQFYGGNADLDAIANLKSVLSIPVIGNGDVDSPEKAAHMLTIADGCMIGRAAMGNPWIFSRTLEYLKSGTLPPEPSEEERIATAIRHVKLLCADKGEYIGIREARRHAAYYLRGMRDSAAMRAQINAAETESEMCEILEGR